MVKNLPLDIPVAQLNHLACISITKEAWRFLDISQKGMEMPHSSKELRTEQHTSILPVISLNSLTVLF
jgi:hypothetical protein